jgi:hypothetical protein
MSTEAIVQEWYGRRWRVTADLWGFKWTYYHDELEDAIRDADGRAHAEVIKVDRYTDEMDPILSTVAIVANGEWILLEEDVTMAKVQAAKQKRDPIADLLGDDDKKNKKGKVNGKKAAPAAKKASGFTDDQKIKVIKKYEPREGTNTAKAWGCVTKASTIRELRKLRKRAGFADDVGGLLGGWVRDGFVRVS